MTITDTLADGPDVGALGQGNGERRAAICDGEVARTRTAPGESTDDGRTDQFDLDDGSAVRIRRLSMTDIAAAIDRTGAFNSRRPRS